MSIPPLVCSTPPPPDQCEDDKDPEDYDLSYSLSQEEDDEDVEDNGYNYGNFSSYNNFQPSPDNKPLEINQEITETKESPQHTETFSKYEDQTECNNSSPDAFRTNDINENKLKCDEELNIEDLNLIVDELDSPVESNVEQNEINEPTGSVKDYDIPSNSNNDSPTCDNTNESFDENAIDISEALKDLNTNFVPQWTVPNDEDKVISKAENSTDNVDSVSEENNCPHEPDKTVKLEDSSINLEDNIQAELSLNVETKSDDNDTYDDFGDFDDFQSVNTKSDIANVVETSKNPWENAEPNESDFRNFTANFEENIVQSADCSPVKTIPVENNLVRQESFETGNNLDDDFGDFDDFKSSTEKTVPNEFTVEDSSHCQEMPVLNLQSTENEQQIMESITKVLSSVFLDEISEPEHGFEGTLESFLSETWGHLMETDERQPYIVNWNNSLGQKTLLKALCIDSRNILFGPKWSSNMPKYAANLSNAPLQPQKQASVPSSIVTQNEIVAEKAPSKATTWTDPFTSDGQEFTYAEALLLDLEHLMATLDQMAHNHSTLKISELLSHACNTENESAAITSGPTDLDVFEASVSTKPDKIYSNTMTVQPLRQINLPDTHIFTPTDSEIPRSKTIHYDRGPMVLLPQSINADSKSQIDPVNTTNINSIENSIDDNEYWEFQNFKSTSVPSSASQQQEKSFETAKTVNALPKPNIAYQTDLLQPIKVEPAMPTLNWPDPGEIKSGFDDFSDFVSQSIDKQDNNIQAVEPHPETIKNKSDNLTITNDSPEVITEVTKPGSGGFDDDFDTFQSALPSKSANNNLKSVYSENITSQVSSHIPEFGSPKFDSIKSDSISFANILRPNEALSQNVVYNSNTTELTKNSLPVTQMQSNLLQPTPASFSTTTQSQQKSGQILQPLSLESYSQINWPSPGIDLQDLSRFNPVETLNSLKSDLNASGLSKGGSPAHGAKNSSVHQIPDDDVWGEFVSSKPKQQQQQSLPKKPSTFVDDDEWTDFISSPSVKPQNGLNTISLNVHTNSNIQKSVQNKFSKKINQPPLDIPTLNYITPKANSHNSYNDKHFQNL